MVASAGETGNDTDSDGKTLGLLSDSELTRA